MPSDDGRPILAHAAIPRSLSQEVLLGYHPRERSSARRSAVVEEGRRSDQEDRQDEAVVIHSATPPLKTGLPSLPGVYLPRARLDRDLHAIWPQGLSISRRTKGLVDRTLASKTS